MEGLKFYARLLWRPPRETLLFALRTVAAGLLTLYLAFLFDLEQPKWALMTVVIVSQPLAGMALKRSFAQVLGTFAGAVVAVLIMALFAQQPLPFFVALGLWLALCTAGGTLLRYTDSHAFVLSGFTAVIVAVLSIPDPENTFMLAVVRVTETLLGVACVALVSLLSARPQAVAKGYFAQVDGLIRSTARHAAAVIRGAEGDESFNQRQMQLVASITALDGLRRHLYFDAPNLRRADGLVQLLGNLLVLMASRLLLLRQHRLLVRAHWVGPLPADIQALLDRALRVLDALAEQGRAVPSEVLEEFQAVRQAFDAAATRAESYDEALSPALRPQVAILRWEYARLFLRLGEVLELNDAIQSGRQASSFYRRGQAQALHLDWALASMNAVRAFVALSCAAWLWITSAWNGALSSRLLVGVMCSLMATFPRPLLAAQNFLRGLLLAILISAALLFVLLPASADFEWLALWMALLLYVVAVGLSSPLSAGIAMGIGLETLLMVAPQNIAVYYSNASQWFEFVGGFLAAAVLAVLVFALVYPFRADPRLRRLLYLSRQDVAEMSRCEASEAQRFAFETRMIDRLAVMVGLLPASQEPAAAERFQCALGCVVMGVALNRLREPLHDAGVVPLELQPLLGEALREVAAYIAGGADAPRQDLALAALRRFGRGLEALLAQPSKDLGATRQRFIMNVAVLILQQSLQRYRTLLEEDRGAPAVVEEPEEEGGHAR
ncbi:FUSC family protein [Pseudomonas aeruginosa]|nr:FUSC family protein [Pseudomonas aeruginosa]